MKELDLKAIPVNERSPDKITQAWKELSPGDTLRLINDHDPKPLRYMFQIEFKDSFAWEYKLEGPREWIVEIKKIKAETPLSDEQKAKRDELKRILKKLHEASPEELDKVKKKRRNISRKLSLKSWLWPSRSLFRMALPARK